MVHRFSAPFLIALTLSACAPVDGADAPLANGQGEPGGGGPSNPDPIGGDERPTAELVVTTDGVPGDYLVTVVRTEEQGDVVLSAGLVEDGVATLRVPMSVGATGTWRIAVRTVGASGAPGPYVDVSAASLVYNPVATSDLGAGWWIRSPGEKGAYRRMDEGVVLGHRLSAVSSALIDGTVAEDLAAADFSMGFAVLMRGQVISVAADGFGLDEDGFALGVGGTPLGLESGRAASAIYWPLAYVDSDGVEGLEVYSDSIVGQVCSEGATVGFRWLEPATSLVAATTMIREGVRPGWMPVVFGEDDALTQLAPDAVITLAESCAG